MSDVGTNVVSTSSVVGLGTKKNPRLPNAPHRIKKHNMPSSLRVGSEVSTHASKTAPFLPPQPGKTRRVRQRVYGVIKRSLPSGKWEVEWGNGKREECAPGILKFMGNPAQGNTAQGNTAQGNELR